MKPINTSTFDFPTLIGKGAVYVDKTAQIYDLAKNEADGIYFFPRPRRFGKSLLISTFKALFQGRRELFRGLAIEKTDWDWEKEVYPVLHLDMSRVATHNPAVFEQNLNNLMRNECSAFGLPFDDHLSSPINFENLLAGLAGLSPNGKFVLLIDEYDAPIAGLLDDENSRVRISEVRQTLHDFYVKAKAHCGDMRFLFVTGVSKFAKTSIFSAFNNPVDLSLDARAADLVGYTREEMETYFHEHIQHFADERHETYAEALAELLGWYDSYQFSPERLVKVVNPVSFGKALSTCAIRGWWEATAGSTLIYDALRATNSAPLDFADEFDTEDLNAPDALTAPTVSLLYQGGYLTIDKRIDDQIVLLKIPNHEVRQALTRGYMSEILGRDFEVNRYKNTAEKTAAALAAEGFTDSFKTLLQGAFSKLPHDWVCRDEREAKRYFLAFMVFANAEVVSESQHATGRPDAVIRTEKGIYVFEFKYRSTAKRALKQCRDRNYAAAFAGDSRPVYYVGVNYSPAPRIRTINQVVCERA